MNLGTEVEGERFRFEGDRSQVLPTTSRTPGLKLSGEMERIVRRLEGDHVRQLFIVDRLCAGNLREEKCQSGHRSKKCDFQKYLRNVFSKIPEKHQFEL